MRVTLERPARLEGTVRVPGDKSISHRALILSALAGGPTRVEGLGPGGDVESTLRCLIALGARMERSGHDVLVQGRLGPPRQVLDCGNSGTTARLLAGVLAGTGLGGTLDGDASLRRRPMARVVAPLRAMGARIGGEALPFSIEPGHPLSGRAHELKVASAQVKSALLLAGLFARGETCVREPALSRDHTERMLPAFGVELRGGCVRGPAALRAPEQLVVPGDPSSAAFLVAVALLSPGSDVTVAGVGLNPTRTGLYRVLERMGADLREAIDGGTGEPLGSIRARAGVLEACTVEADEIPSLIDEVPVLAVLATQARGRTEIRGAGELRVKESDRLAAMAARLVAMGAHVEETADGLVIDGPTPLRGTTLDGAGDHRVAMALAVAGLAARGTTTLDGAEWADISFPGFFEVLRSLGAKVR